MAKQQQLKEARKELRELTEKHGEIERVIMKLREEEKLPSVQSIQCVQKKWSTCIENFEMLDTKNKETVDSLSTLANRYSELKILQKFLQCAVLLQESVSKISNALNDENEKWKQLITTVGDKKAAFQAEWILDCLPIFYTLETEPQRITHIKKSLQKIGEGSLRILQFANEEHELFANELKQRLKERLEVLFVAFKWPTPNHKLSKELEPLTFSTESEEQEEWLHVHPINSLLRQKSIEYIVNIDQRLELFTAIFIFGIRMQQALGELKISQDTKMPQHPSVWVLDALFEPIASRFIFHFINESSTNNIEKPEWCFSFIGNILSDHAEFLLGYIQPLLNREARSHVIPDAKNILIGKLLNILERKMLQDIPLLLVSNQSLYCHTLSECVKLEKLLFEVHNYPNGFPSPMQNFAFTSDLFDAWVRIESHVFSRQLSRVLSNPQKWEKHFEALADIDQLKPTISAESVIVMTEFLTERFSRLLDSKQKLRMVEDIQIPKLLKYCNAMKKFFLQLAEAENLSADLIMQLCRLCNSANYISLILVDWSEKLIFLELQFLKEQQSKTDEERKNFFIQDLEGVMFHEPILLSDKIVEKSLHGISSAIARSFQVYSEAYFDRSSDILSNSIQYDISPDMCSPLYELKFSIEIVLEELAAMLLQKFWNIFTKELDDYLLAGILNGRARYTQNAAEQLRFNMKVLFSFIHPHYKPQGTAVFPKTKDAIHILIMDNSDLRHLQDDLYLLNGSEQRRVLMEYRISVLSGRETEKLIKKRSDLPRH